MLRHKDEEFQAHFTEVMTELTDAVEQLSSRIRQLINVSKSHAPLTKLDDTPEPPDPPKQPLHLLSMEEIILKTAEKCEGWHEEKDNERLQNLFFAAGFKLDPEHIPWCAAFVRAILHILNLKPPESNRAKDFAIGQSFQVPEVGMLSVWNKHVAFVHSIDPDGNVKVIGGNQKDMVCIAPASWFHNYSQHLGYHKIQVGSWNPPSDDEIDKLLGVNTDNKVYT